MDFEEWFESRDDIGCLIGLEGYAAKEAWNARPAEIDALKAKINEAKEEISNFFDNQTKKPTDREYCNKLADILEILK